MLSLHGLPALAQQKPSDSLGVLAYAVMFDSSVSVQKVDALIRQCLAKAPRRMEKIPSYRQAPGILSVQTYALPLERLRETITTPRKHDIFTSTCYAYHRNLSEKSEKAFLNEPRGSVKFKAHLGIKGKFGTRFTGTVQGEWIKSGEWFMEREVSMPGVSRVQGIGGYINFFHAFVILVPLNRNKTLRIQASWNDAGGKLPVVGDVKASHKDIMEGLKTGEKEIKRYFKLP